MKKLFLLIIVLMVAACRPKVLISDSQSTGQTTSYQRISAEELSKSLKNKDFLFVNVHIPVEGNIPDTDLDIAYDKIEKHIDQFPADKNAKIVLYCRSGAMGDVAAQTLSDLGYTNVFNLEGGYEAWEAAGYPYPEE